jgi:hypothetical protein
MKIDDMEALPALSGANIIFKGFGFHLGWQKRRAMRRTVVQHFVICLSRKKKDDGEHTNGQTLSLDP